MNKLLTISIAAYNMEPYIERTLNSLLDRSIIDQLEIIIVDDGGTDRTLEIAQQYAKQYPQSIFPIHKENGGYGSTINTSIELATGKYFKQLDGDDWFETENLISFVKLLDHVDADYIITQAIKYYQKQNQRMVQDCCDYLQEGYYKFSEIDFQNVVSMYCSTFRTSVLKDMHIQVTENCFYTDMEFVCLPVPNIQTVYVWHQPIYVYFIGREGQSVSIPGFKKHYKERERVFWNIMNVYNQLDEKESSQRQFIKNRLVDIATGQFAVYCYIDHFMDKKKEMKIFYRTLQERCPDILEAALHRRKFLKLYSFSKGLLYPFLAKYIRNKDFNKK